MGLLKSIRDDAGTSRAVIFLHGFAGEVDDTWGSFPTLLGTETHDWDIHTLGYETSFLPDMLGVWAADPDLPIVATMLNTQFSIAPLARYNELAIVAHSMGGLAIQRSLLDSPSLVPRVKKLFLFGTPSGGLIKAWWVRWWKRQFKNMSADGAFIKQLRARWKRQFGSQPPFELTVVAGSRDQFVPPSSSLAPFDAQFHYVVPGNHLEIVKPKDNTSESLRLVLSKLNSAVTLPAGTRSPTRLAAEGSRSLTVNMSVSFDDNQKSESDIVEQALALERSGRRDESIALLERHRHRGTDVQGALAGRIKRIWIETNDIEHAKRAYRLYRNALLEAIRMNVHSQIAYHAINLAFLQFVAFDDIVQARENAELAFRHCQIAVHDKWSRATMAEAFLYLGEQGKAVESYRSLRQEPFEPWEFASMAMQAAQVAARLDDRWLSEQLDLIFGRGATPQTRIFVSYSHKDASWLKRLTTHLKPYLAGGEGELDLWDDTRIKPGMDWESEINSSLSSSKVVILLVSAEFLASSFVVNNELPAILEAVKRKQTRLVWVHVSPAALDTQDLTRFQAAFDPAKSLVELPYPDQERALQEIARSIKKVALDAGAVRKEM